MPGQLRSTAVCCWCCGGDGDDDGDDGESDDDDDDDDESDDDDDTFYLKIMQIRLTKATPHGSLARSQVGPDNNKTMNSQNPPAKTLHLIKFHKNA